MFLRGSSHHRLLIQENDDLIKLPCVLQYSLYVGKDASLVRSEMSSFSAPPSCEQAGLSFSGQVGRTRVCITI